MYKCIKSKIKNRTLIGLYHRLNKIIAYPSLIKDYYQFRSLSAKTSQRFIFQFKDIYPCLAEKTSATEFDRHYVYHPAWAARILSQTKPEFHVDISSTLYFCSIVSAFIPIKFYDYRPADLNLEKLQTHSADLLNLPFDNGSVNSLSCMHVVEHIGLGRYGDPLDPDGDLKAISELIRVLAPDGNLLFVVPVGKKSRIMFNAHRIYSYEQILSYFSVLKLMEFALIPDDPNAGGLIYNASSDMVDACTYGCGCFWFKKCIKTKKLTL
jgi:SAM-dependent methyltransferase